MVSYSCATFCASAIALAASLSSAAASGSETLHFVHNALFVVTTSGRHKTQRVKNYEEENLFQHLQHRQVQIPGKVHSLGIPAWC